MKDDTELERLLSSYFDGELSRVEQEAISRRLKNGDPAVVEGLDALQAMRQGVREWFQELCRDEIGARREVDIWAALEGQLTQRGADEGTSRRAWSEFVEGIRMMLRPPAFAGAVAAVAVVLYFSAGKNQPVSPAQPISVAQIAVERQATPQVADSNRLMMVRAARREVIPLSMPEATRALYRDELMRQYEPGVRSLMPLVDRDFVLGGLRANGADIDWIKSEKTFNLYPTRDREIPPIIWVARHLPDEGAYADLD